MGGPAQKDSKAKGEGKNERGGGEAPETLRATDVYERLTEVWACENVDAQKAKIAEVFELDDGPGVCREALNLEYTFNALLYAHERRFSLKQTKWFHNLINTLRDAIKEPDSSLEEITNRLRTLLLDPLRPPPPKKLKSKSLVPEEEDKKSKVGSSKVVRGKKRVKTSKFKKKSSKKDFKKEDNEPKPEEAVPVTPPPLLTKEEAKGVIDYVKDTILTHFSLYKAVFSESVFEEDKKEVRYPVGKCPDGSKDTPLSYSSRISLSLSLSNLSILSNLRIVSNLSHFLESLSFSRISDSLDPSLYIIHIIHMYKYHARRRKNLVVID
ncbi:hypothetical protein AAMO2058_000214500 [Amorphochlora amoebiformis]